MGFINQNLDDIKEGEYVEEGTYNLRIVKVKDGTSRKGSAMTTVTIKIEDAPIPNANPITHFLVYPDSETPADQRQMRLLDIKRFLALFGVAYTGDGFDTDDLQGQTAECFLTIEEGEDKVMRNKLRLPRLKE